MHTNQLPMSFCLFLENVALPHAICAYAGFFYVCRPYKNEMCSMVLRNFIFIRAIYSTFDAYVNISMYLGNNCVNTCNQVSQVKLRRLELVS